MGDTGGNVDLVYLVPRISERFENPHDGMGRDASPARPLPFPHH